LPISFHIPHTNNSPGNDYMTDNLGYGQEKRRQGNLATLNDEITFRDSFRDMLDSVSKPFDECTPTTFRASQ
jgi:2-hydroxy-3-keto-5-methylthiopentenyl-1-phosphate phosphatase